MALPDLAALEQELKDHSHGDKAITILQSALKDLDLGARQKLLNAHLVCDPIEHAQAVAYMPTPPEHFSMLQGDIIRTEAAYCLGKRQVGLPSFLVTTSTCDLVLGRKASHGEPAIVSLLRVDPRHRSGYPSERAIIAELQRLLQFETKKYLYLPPLKDDDEDILFNVVHLGAHAQMANGDLPAAQRRASLTVIGWRVFGGLLRCLQIREAAEEADLRIAAAQSPYRRQQTA